MTQDLRTSLSFHGATRVEVGRVQFYNGSRTSNFTAMDIIIYSDGGSSQIVSIFSETGETLLIVPPAEEPVT